MEGAAQRRLHSLTRPISPPGKRRRQNSHHQTRINTASEEHGSQDTRGARDQTPWIRTPLDSTCSNIRVFKLCKGSHEMPIICNLQVVSLDNDPYYEVLSYVWGEANITKLIYVDGVRFDTTENLFDFLHNLRLLTADRYIWADAICIQQSNEEEKSHQIGLMTKIYRQANEAHVWFGPFDLKSWDQEFANDHKYTSLSKMTPKKWDRYQREGSTSLTYLVKQEGFKPMLQSDLEQFIGRCQEDIFLHTLAALDEMAKGDHLYTYPVVVLGDRRGTDPRYILNKSWLLVLDCIRWLLTRPWWSRVWTLQEASLPRTDPIVHAPPYSFRLSRLLKGVDSMWHHNNSICCKWFGQPILTSNRDNHEFGSTYTQCCAVYQQREVLAEADHEGLGVPLELVINATQGRRATEIRDHWFGIFGFLPEKLQEQSKSFPTPSTVVELFSQSSNMLYLENASLTELDMARRCQPSRVGGLPSWAIDLSDPRRGNEEDSTRWKLYNASGGTKYDRITEWPELSTPELSVKAIHIGSVQACAERGLPAHHTPEDVRGLVKNWLRVYRDTAHPFDISAFWRAAFKDRNVQTHFLERRKGPLIPARLDDIKDWWTAWDRTGDHRDLTVDRKAGGAFRGRFHYKELSMNAERTKFFVTSQGLPGMGPHDMRSGDEVYALAGCKALVVLRLSTEEQVEGPIVVGLCFVDRWMYGRALQGRAVWRTMRLY